jgi:hypothetical protein
MAINPWIAEQLARTRIDDLRRTAGVDQSTHDLAGRVWRLRGPRRVRTRVRGGGTGTSS